MAQKQKYSEAELIEILRRVAERNGGRPLSWRRYGELRTLEEPTGNTYRSSGYFGTWNAALDAAGLPRGHSGRRMGSDV